MMARMTRLALVLGTMGAVLPAMAETIPQFTAMKSPAGMPFYHRFDDATPFAAISFGLRDRFAASSKGKEGFPGLAGSFVMQGADGAGQTEFIERLRDLTASASVSFGAFQTTGIARAPGDKLGDAMSLLIAALKSAQPSDRVLARIRQQAKGGEAQAEARAETVVARAALRVALGDHPATRAMDRTRFDRISREDLSDWRRRVLDKAKLRVVASGRISAEAAGRIIDQAFAGLPDRLAPIEVKWPPAAVASRTIVVEQETPQAAVVILGLTRIVEGPDAATAAVANAILGGGASSRLWQAVRAGLGSSYGAYAGIQIADPTQRLVTMRAAVANDQVKASIEAMRSAYTTWWNAGITASELQATTSRMINEFEGAFNDPSRANGVVLGLLLANRPVADLNAYPARLRALTPDKVNAFIKVTFPAPDQLMTVIATPKAEGLGADCVVRSADDAGTCRK